MRKKIVLALGFVLLGCGGGNDTPTASTATDAFIIGDTTWEITLPSDWQKLAVPQGFNALMLAQKDSQNFAILQEVGAPENLGQEIFTKAEEDFLMFEAVDFSEKTNTWRFRGKTTPDKPVREFIQKVFLIPNTNAFLLGSCSWEPTINTSTDCQKLINSWQIPVDEEQLTKSK
jgi:hypothetical protein